VAVEKRVPEKIFNTSLSGVSVTISSFLDDSLKDAPFGYFAESEMYTIPDESSNVAVRTISMARLGIPYTDDLDCPDLEYLFTTDLPWSGIVSFEKSKYAPKEAYLAKVEVVREYDGLLYTLSLQPDHRSAPKILRVWDKGDDGINVDIRPATRPVMHVFNAAKNDSPSLISSLESLGIQRESEGVFSISGNGVMYSTLYGVMQRMKSCGKSSRK